MKIINKIKIFLYFFLITRCLCAKASYNEKLKTGLEFSVSMNIPSPFRESISFFDSKYNEKTNKYIPYIGINLGYDLFQFLNQMDFSLELGANVNLFLHSMQYAGYIFQERFLNIPIKAIVKIDQYDLIDKIYFFLGVNLKFLISSKYSIINNTIVEEWVDNNGLSKEYLNKIDLAKSDFTNNFYYDILFGLGINMVFIYIQAQIHIPSIFLSEARNSDLQTKGPGESEFFVTTNRKGISPFVSISFGIDIMKIFNSNENDDLIY